MSALDVAPEIRVAANEDAIDCIVWPCRVVLFKPRFAQMVERGEKLQTVRPLPKRMPKPGMRLSLREWTGKPYRSPQRVLRETTLKGVWPVEIDLDCSSITYCGVLLRRHEIEQFARLDGFRDMEDLLAWFDETHRVRCFRGIVLTWPNGSDDPREAGK